MGVTFKIKKKKKKKKIRQFNGKRIDNLLELDKF